MLVQFSTERLIYEPCCLVPFLGSVDDVVLSIGALSSCRNDIRNITASLGLSDRNASALLAGKQVRKEALLQFLASELDNGRDTKGKASVERATRAAQTRPAHLSRFMLAFSSLWRQTVRLPYFITVDSSIDIIPIFNLDAQNIVDPYAFAPIDG